jgi:hypothetical protein
VAYSPGALHRLAIDEPDEHCVYVGYDDGALARHVLASRVAVRRRIKSAAELDDFLAHDLIFLAECAADIAKKADLPDELRTPILRVHYHHDLPDALPRLREGAAGKFHLFATALDPGRAPGDAHAQGPNEIGEVPPDDPAEPPAGLLEVLATYDLTATGDADPEGLRADLARLLAEDRPAARAVEALAAERLAP